VGGLEWGRAQPHLPVASSVCLLAVGEGRGLEPLPLGGDVEFWDVKGGPASILASAPSTERGARVIRRQEKHYKMDAKMPSQLITFFCSRVRFPGPSTSAFLFASL